MNANLHGVPFAQSSHVTAQSVQGVRVIAALFDACHLGLGHAQSPGDFGLRQVRVLAGLDEGQPQFLLFGFLLVSAPELWVGNLSGPVFVVAFLPFGLWLVHRPRSST
ncbi:MAG TPA: hypothetical protein VIK11_10930 [Tepidiformaceae bacterium]